eukprot:Skav232152  [mRNA]  locus=scaffold1040:269811:272067:- [translate_table: standard]
MAHSRSSEESLMPAAHGTWTADGYGRKKWPQDAMAHDPGHAVTHAPKPVIGAMPAQDPCSDQLGSCRQSKLLGDGHEANHRHCKVSAPICSQALFHTGLIPGETDFRIYRDFGDIPGVDFAVLTNGWVYHTWRDDLEHLDFRSLQRYGELWRAGSRFMRH